MQISEIFYSVQGEGKNVGVPTIFIRTATCNLSCDFCDSSYASREQGKSLTQEAVLGHLSDYSCKNVCLTGGEPVFQQDFGALVKNLLVLGYNIEVETNGTLRPPMFCLFSSKIQWNVSPKLSNSGNALDCSIQKDLLTVYNLTNHIFKFVIGNHSDFVEASDLIRELGLINVYMMPQGITDKDLKETSLWLVEQCKKYDYNFSPRLHVWLWEGKGGV